MEVHSHLHHEQSIRQQIVGHILNMVKAQLCFRSRAVTSVREARHLWRKFKEILSDVNLELAGL